MVTELGIHASFINNKINLDDYKHEDEEEIRTNSRKFNAYIILTHLHLDVGKIK
jgi:hypothetical protein